MSDTLINLEIDGQPVQARRGAMIIEAADSADIRIPRFCYHKKLSIAANCRMCLVEVEKAPKPVPACAFPVAEGMKVFTRSPKALDAQRGTMEFLLINHPLDCPICDQGGECELQDVAMGYGRDISRYAERKRVVMDQSLGPLVATDMTRCIHCTRCVRFGTEVAGIREIGATGRGEFTEIGTFVERSLTSELSGNIIDLCPVGALTAKPSRFAARAWEMIQQASLAVHDAVGSNVYHHVLRGRVVRTVPCDNEAVNETWLSDRDRFSYQGLSHAERLLSPEVRQPGGGWQNAEWEDALKQVAEALKSTPPAEIGAWISPRSTLEEIYLLQKLLRALGVASIDHRLRQSDFSDEDDAPLFPWLGMPLSEVERLDTVLLIGCDVRREAPLLGLRLRKLMHRAAVMDINPQAFDFHFRLAERQTCGAALAQRLAGVARAVLEGKGSTPPAALAWLSSVQPTAADERMAKRLLNAKQGWLLLGGIAERDAQFATLRALATLIADQTGVRLGYLPEAANSAGAWLAGALPHRLAGGLGGGTRGLNYGQMLRQPPKLLLLFGVEPEFDCENPPAALAAMRSARQVVSLGSFAGGWLREHAHVLLPLTAVAETHGSFVNAEGRWQVIRPVAPPPGEAKEGWKVLRVLGAQLGLSGFEFTRYDELKAEVRAACAGETELSNRTLLTRALAAPMPSGSGLQRSSTLSLYGCDALARRARALQETPEAQEAESVAMNAAQAQAMGFADGAEIRVRQDSHEVMARVSLSDAVPENTVCIQLGTRLAARLGSNGGAIEIAQAVN